MNRIYHLFVLVCIAYVGAEASSAFQMPSKCNAKDSLLITTESPIYLKNYESKWADETNHSPCRIAFTTSPNSPTTFLIRFDLIKAYCEMNTSQISMAINENQSLITQVDNVCSRFLADNYITFKVASNYFEISFTDSSTKDAEYHLFQAINSITVTQYKNATDSGCNEDKGEFKCAQPSYVCLSKGLKCDAIASCPDGSDEGDCDAPSVSVSISGSDSDPSANTSEPLTTATQTAQTTLNSTTTASNSTSTAAVLITKPAYERRYDIFIGLLGIFLFVTLILVGIWLYGRRKRQWRDFLARLDNNTDWEYEQLEDGPAINASVSRTNVIFNINDDAFDPSMDQSYNKTPNYNTNNASRNAKLTERTPVRP